MNEIDVLDYFYDELRSTGQTRNTLFLNLDELAVTKLKAKLNIDIQLADLHQYADICIANQWLERTTADQEYRYLSLTDSGLQVAISHQYRNDGSGTVSE
jgi:hypothetical protein